MRLQDYNKIRILLFIVFLGLSQLWCVKAGTKGKKTKTIHSVKELVGEINKVQPGTTLLLEDGIYLDIKLIVKNSGTPDQPITIKAKNPGEVFFSGDVKVELRGEHIILDGLYFKEGNRDINKWKSHGPGLVAIYGSHNRITQCAFHYFDQANSAYITTSLTKDGKVPQYCRIDHCSFTEKITFDQVINLNNKPKKTKEGKPGIPMYHRIDHCFFSNPRKPGNAGGGIRIGYWRRDLGRCLVDSNLFMRQDSEPEIITSKSQENVYYANTYKNCQGTMNFRHGDKQVAINNFYIGDDTMYQYGGMFVWGSNHIIACNYFELPTTLKTRGNAALYLNPGAKGKEHALAFNILLANNVFANNNGYAIHFDPLYDRRVDWCKKNNYTFEVPHHIQIKGNIFYSNQSYNYSFFKDNHPKGRNNSWENNLACGQELGIRDVKGIEKQQFSMKKDDQKIFRLKKQNSHHKVTISQVYNIERIDLNFKELINGGIKGKPLTWEEVGPNWLKEIPGNYAKTGKLKPETKAKFKEVINRRRKK